MRKTLSASFILAAFLFFFVSSSHAEIKAETYSIMPFIGGYTFEGNEDLESKAVYGIRFGYDITKEWGVEGTFDWLRTNYSTNIANSDVDTYGYRLEALYHFLPQGKLVPFLAAGVGDRTAHYTNPSITRDRNQILAVYGAGLKYFLYKDIALRGDIRHMILLNDNYNNLEYTIGLAYYFGGPKPAPLDSDKDGVTDNYDKCPGTPIGVRVDRDGCPLDTDRDGVPDYLDKCPGTPAGVKVDKDGCPPDTDKDGVPDYLDKCPATPAGVKVDKVGCPPDTDKDGVPDYLDKCPGTPAGVKVDQYGCPPVEQLQEVRAEAPAAAAVVTGEQKKEAAAAAVVTGEQKKEAAAAAVVSKEMFEKGRATIKIKFDFDKADVKPAFNKEIKKFADVMKNYPDLKVVIEGHTDRTGKKAYNQKLSEKRANSVKSYMTEKFGIEESRLTARGYGESKPIVSNKTKAGRRKNRRVEAAVDYKIKR